MAAGVRMVLGTLREVEPLRNWVLIIAFSKCGIKISPIESMSKLLLLTKQCLREQ
jgi:hypothetical protein